MNNSGRGDKADFKRMDMKERTQVLRKKKQMTAYKFKQRRSVAKTNLKILKLLIRYQT